MATSEPAQRLTIGRQLRTVGAFSIHSVQPETEVNESPPPTIEPPTLEPGFLLIGAPSSQTPIQMMLSSDVKTFTQN